MSKVIAFTASWCKPCQTMKPLFEEFGIEQIDRDNNPDLTILYQVKTIPALFHVNSDGEVLDRVDNSMNRQQLTAWLSHLTK